MTLDASIIKIQADFKGNEINIFSPNPNKKEYEKLLISEIADSIISYYQLLEEVETKIHFNIKSSYDTKTTLSARQLMSRTSLEKDGFLIDGVMKKYEIERQKKEDERLNILKNDIDNQYNSLEQLRNCFDLLISLHAKRMEVIQKINNLDRFYKDSSSLSVLSKNHKKDIKTFDFVISIKVKIKYKTEPYTFTQLAGSFTNAKSRLNSEYEVISEYALANEIGSYLKKDSKGNFIRNRNMYELDRELIRKIKDNYIQEIKKAISKEVKLTKKFSEYKTFNEVYGYFL